MDADVNLCCLPECLTKIRYSLRPVDMEALSLCQFVMWYRTEKPREEAANAQQGTAVPIVTAADLAPLAVPLLPPVLTLTDGTRLRRLRHPRAVGWAPRTEYGRLVMFKVNHLEIGLSYVEGHRGSMNPCQAWRDEAVQLGEFLEPEAAATEAAVPDMAGGMGESRVQGVERQLILMFRNSFQ
jgi:hypothetical protein